MFFTVPMAHFLGIPARLRERFGVPVVFYDGDVPMSLPEFGGMDTGFNYYHGADPSEYDVVLSNSEGGLERLRELARVARSRCSGLPTLTFSAPVKRTRSRRLLLRIRRQVPARMDAGVRRRSVAPGTRDRLRTWRPGLPRRHRQGADHRRCAVQRLRARDPAARVNLNITRRSHATVRASSLLDPSSSRQRERQWSQTRSRGWSGGSSLGESCSSPRAPTMRSLLSHLLVRSRTGRGARSPGPRACPRRAHLCPQGEAHAGSRRHLQARERGCLTCPA